MQFYEKVDIAEIRAKLGMTQQEMADFLGVARTYIAMIESGMKPFSDKMRRKIQEKLSNFPSEATKESRQVDTLPTSSTLSSLETRLGEVERKLGTIESLLLQIIDRLKIKDEL